MTALQSKLEDEHAKIQRDELERHNAAEARLQGRISELERSENDLRNAKIELEETKARLEGACPLVSWCSPLNHLHQMMRAPHSLAQSCVLLYDASSCEECLESPGSPTFDAHMSVISGMVLGVIPGLCFLLWGFSETFYDDSKCKSLERKCVLLDMRLVSIHIRLGLVAPCILGCRHSGFHPTRVGRNKKHCRRD